MRILICGGRDYDDYIAMQVVLNTIVNSRIDARHIVVISGGARGADTLAEKWGNRNGYIILRYPADWGKYGKSAGPIRNIQMLEQGKPDLVVAFPGGRGTAHMVKIAREAGVETICI